MEGFTNNDEIPQPKDYIDLDSYKIAVDNFNANPPKAWLIPSGVSVPITVRNTDSPIYGSIILPTTEDIENNTKYGKATLYNPELHPSLGYTTEEKNFPKGSQPPEPTRFKNVNQFFYYARIWNQNNFGEDYTRLEAYELTKNSAKSNEENNNISRDAERTQAFEELRSTEPWGPAYGVSEAVQKRVYYPLNGKTPHLPETYKEDVIDSITADSELDLRIIDSMLPAEEIVPRIYDSQTGKLKDDVRTYKHYTAHQAQKSIESAYNLKNDLKNKSFQEISKPIKPAVPQPYVPADLSGLEGVDLTAAQFEEATKQLKYATSLQLNKLYEINLSLYEDKKLQHEENVKQLYSTNRDAEGNWTGLDPVQILKVSVGETIDHPLFVNYDRKNLTPEQLFLAQVAPTQSNTVNSRHALELLQEMKDKNQLTSSLR